MAFATMCPGICASNVLLNSYLEGLLMRHTTFTTTALTNNTVGSSKKVQTSFVVGFFNEP